MTPFRLTRAREMAGLSIGQAAKRLGWARGPLHAMEIGAGHSPSDDDLRRLAELYGVSVEWLRGEAVELPESTRQLLREVDHDGDRARLTELLTAIQGGRR